MNKILFSSILFAISIFMFSCGDDDATPDVVELEYHAHIHQPNVDDKNVDDTISIMVDFESHTGETIHHISVRIYNVADETEVYNKPDSKHIHESDGEYTYMDEFVLSNDNGVMEDSDWILEAKVWGQEAGVGEVIETVQFHVHP